MMKTDMM